MANLDIVKNAVAEGTRELMRSKTLDEITVTEICEKVSLSRRNFYRYFHDKYEVVQWIYYHDALLKSRHYKDCSIWDYMPRITQTLYNDRKYYANAFRCHGQNSFRSYCTQYLSEVIGQDYAEAFPDSVTLDFFIEHICEMSFDAFVLWLSREPCLSPEEFLALFRGLFLKVAKTSCELITRSPAEPKQTVSFNPPEPSKK